jgi:protein-tyrosine phosphatase
MIEAILKHKLQASNPSVTVSSAGLTALVGYPADPLVQSILQEEGIDCSMHRARQLTLDILRDCDIVLVMDDKQRKEIEYKFPSMCGKVHLLGKWGEFDIPDPYKKSKEFFKETHRLIVQGIDQWQTKLWN